MLIDRDKFYAGYRAAFGPLKQSQVNGLNKLLTRFSGDLGISDPRQIAYMLATIKHECADTWWPITEYGRRPYFNRYEPGTKIGDRLGNVNPGDGYLYRGRGYVQITGRENYARLGVMIDADLVGDPDQALGPGVAYLIMSLGMQRGAFTGKKLADYIFADRCDYKNARRIINGLDRWSLIKGYAEAFEAIL